MPPTALLHGVLLLLLCSDIVSILHGGSPSVIGAGEKKEKLSDATITITAGPEVSVDGTLDVTRLQPVADGS